jgi:NADH dehydrogenase (ubiquinone) 1 alpha/beta subcomplex 1
MIIKNLVRTVFTHSNANTRLARAFGGPNGIPTLTPFPREEGHGYYLDPEEVAKRLMRVISMHDKVSKPQDMTLSKTWHNLGIDDLSKVEIFLEIEKEFDMEFADEDVERFKNIREAVEHVARSFHAR